MSAVIRSADETRALSSRIHSLQLSNHLDDTHATLSATALQLCSVDRTRAVTLTHTYIIPDHTVNDRTWFRAMVTRTCSVQSALQHACRVLFLVHVHHVPAAIPLQRSTTYRTSPHSGHPHIRRRSADDAFRLYTIVSTVARWSPLVQRGFVSRPTAATPRVRHGAPFQATVC